MIESKYSNGAQVLLALVVTSLSFWMASMWGSAVFDGLSYYYLPAGAAAFALAATLALVLLKADVLPQHWGVPALLAVFAFFCGLADGLLADHGLLSRWVAWGQFQAGDANDFIHTASSYLVHASFETPRGRVASNMLYAGLLDLTNIDVVASARAVTFMTTLGCSLAILMAYRLWGAVASLVFALVLFDFAQEHIGGTSTEMPGFLLGVLAFGMLLQGASKRSGPLFLLGFGLLCAAMLTRIGAAFVLPALVVWSGFALRPMAARRWTVPVVATGLLLALFLGNGALTRAVAPSAGGSFINAADSWYASLIEGQLLLGTRQQDTVIPVTRWRQLYLDHPELEAMPAKDMPARKREILISAVAKAPLAALVGGAREVVVYFARFRMYQFVEIKPVRVALTALTCLGFFVCWRNVRRGNAAPVDSLLVVGALAIVASLPFLYGGETRAPAPTVGFLAGLGAIGARQLWRIGARQLWRIRARRFATSIPADIPDESKSDGLVGGPNVVGPIVGLAAVFSALLIYGWSSGKSWVNAETHCRDQGLVGPVYMNADAARLYGPDSPRTGEHLMASKQAVTALRLSMPMMAAIAFDVNEARFGGFAETVTGWNRARWVGHGLDLTTGRLYPYASTATVQKSPLIGCAKQTPFGVEMLTEPGL